MHNMKKLPPQLKTLTLEKDDVLVCIVGNAKPNLFATEEDLASVKKLLLEVFHKEQKMLIVNDVMKFQIIKKGKNKGASK